MRINVNLSIVTSALILMAVASLLAMISITQIDQLVHGDLYNFGLEFSYRWAMPYWVNSAVIVGLSLFNIFASIVLTYYVFRGKKRASKLKANQILKIGDEDSQQHKMGEYLQPHENRAIDAGEKPTLGLRGATGERWEEKPENLIETQIAGQYCLAPKQLIRKYDVRRPKDLVDSQC